MDLNWLPVIVLAGTDNYAIYLLKNVKSCNDSTFQPSYSDRQKIQKKKQSQYQFF
jgi:hypothetical protein